MDAPAREDLPAIITSGAVPCHGPDSAVGAIFDNESTKHELTISPELALLTITPDHEAPVTAAQFALDQPPILRALMTFLPVASNTLKYASLVSRSWHGAAVAHINCVSRDLLRAIRSNKPPLLRLDARMVTGGLRRVMSPTEFERLVLTRSTMRPIAASRTATAAMLRVFHFIDSWKPSEAKLKRLMLVLATQPQPKSPPAQPLSQQQLTLSPPPLLMDVFLASCPRTAHLGFIWTTMEAVLEADAHAVLAHLAAIVARAGGNLAPPPRPATETAAAVPTPLAALVAETNALEGLDGGAALDLKQAARHRLAEVDRRLLLAVHAWSVRWLSMVQVSATNGDSAEFIKGEVAKGVRWPILSGPAIDASLWRIFMTLDDTRRLSWETLLHQILRCTNKWLGIIGSIVRILDVLEENQVPGLAQDMFIGAQLAQDAQPEINQTE
ncbi:hypothetical protein BC828DRAFT_384358 [Blastocladiella britannica]|nr:hypothetical protein BC828DRAFT_384358 [Blastocladiella britannica]